MNDRLKFRGMTLGGEWVYGNLAIIKEKIKAYGMIIDAGYYISNKVGMPFAYPVRPETLGQCTGLKDKNGKLIYEGDIVEIMVWDDIEEDMVETKGKIYWSKEDAAFLIYVAIDEEYSLNDYETMYGQEIKVIGNIHENSDLLENEE